MTVLEGILAKCVCQDVSAHHQYRPHTEGETSGSDTMSIPIDLEDAVVAQEGQELSLATQLLKASGLMQISLRVVECPFS